MYNHTIFSFLLRITTALLNVRSYPRYSLEAGSLFDWFVPRPRPKERDRIRKKSRERQSDRNLFIRLS